MKHRDLIKILNEKGFKLLRHGANHDVYFDGRNIIPVPRSKEIKENLVRQIMKEMGR